MAANQGRLARARSLNILKILVSVAGVVVLLLTQDLRQVGLVLRQLDWRPFVAALALLLAGSVVRAYRWGSLLWALGARVSLGRLTRLYFVGSFFNLFLPTGLGGDAVKMYEVSRGDGTTAAAISSVLVDRFLGLFVLFGIALLALASSRQLAAPGIRLFLAAVFVVFLAGTGLLWQRTWLQAWARRLGLVRLLGRFRLLRDLYASIYRFGSGALARALAASLVWNLFLVPAYYLLGLAVGIAAPLGIYFLLVPVISALQMLPSVGGLGIREGGTVLLFAQAGVGEPQALSLAVIYDVTLLFIALIGATLYIHQGIEEAQQRGEGRG